MLVYPVAIRCQSLSRARPTPAPLKPAPGRNARRAPGIRKEARSRPPPPPAPPRGAGGENVGLRVPAPSPPLPLHRLGNLTLHRVSGGPLLPGIGKHPEVIPPGLVDETEQPVERGRGLPRKPDDQRGPEEDAFDPFPH